MPGKSAESLVLKVAAHQVEPLMPPGDNNVEAKDLTPEELGLLAAWIDQGAIGDLAAAAPVKWQTLPNVVQPIYAVATSTEGQLAAAARGNQIYLYDLATGGLAARLVDPELSKTGLYGEPGVAHFDLVQSLAFSPDGEHLASGAYREVKLWKRSRNGTVARSPLAQDSTGSLAISPDGKLAALGDVTGSDHRLGPGHRPDVQNAHRPYRPGRRAGLPLGRFIGQRIGRSNRAAVEPGRRHPSGSDRNASPRHRPDRAGWRPAAGHRLARWHRPHLETRGRSGQGHGLEQIAELAGHKGPVIALVGWSKDKKVILSASADGSIRQWKVEPAANDTGSQTREIAAGGPVAGLAMRPDGEQMASVGGGNLVKLWKVEDGQPWTDPSKQPLPELKGDLRAAARAAARKRMADLVAGQLADAKKAVTDGEAKIVAATETKKTTATGKETAQKTLTEKTEVVKKATAAKEAADKLLAAVTALVKPAQDAVAPFQQAADQNADNAELKQLLEAAKKLAADTEERAQGRGSRR